MKKVSPIIRLGKPSSEERGDLLCTTVKMSGL